MSCVYMAGKSFSHAAGMSSLLSDEKLMHGLSIPRRRQFMVRPSASCSRSNLLSARCARAAFSSASRVIPRISRAPSVNDRMNSLA